MLSLPNSVEGKGSCWELAGHGSIQAPPAFQRRMVGSQQGSAVGHGSCPQRTTLLDCVTPRNNLFMNEWLYSHRGGLEQQPSKPWQGTSSDPPAELRGSLTNREPIPKERCELQTAHWAPRGAAQVSPQQRESICTPGAMLPAPLLWKHKRKCVSAAVGTARWMCFQLTKARRTQPWRLCSALVPR